MAIHNSTSESIPESKTIVQCQFCGIDFAVYKRFLRDGAGKYCSNQCKNKANAKRYAENRVNLNCPVCHKKFYAAKSQSKRCVVNYCSKECQAIGQSGKRNGNYKQHELLFCKYCGKEYEIPPSGLKRNSHYCSRKCQGKAKAKIFPVKICPICGLRYRTRNKYCSRKCYNAYRQSEEFKTKRIRIKKNCEECGLEFEVKRATNSYGQGRFCSRHCFGVAKIKSMGDHFHTKGISGRRLDLNNQYFRSRWEANYARYLNHMVELGEIKSWDFEPVVFVFPEGGKTGSAYTPDFLIVYPDLHHEWHEVKGYFSEACQLKLKTMNRLYPNETVVLIREKEYKELTAKFGWLPGWEFKPN